MVSPSAFRPSDQHLSRHVTVLAGDDGGRYPHGNSVLVTGSEGIVLVDPSLSVHGRGGVPAVVDRVLVSHAHEDHVAGLSALGPLPVHAHEADVGCLRSIDAMMEVYGVDPGPDRVAWQEKVAADFHFVAVPDATGFADGDVFDLGDVTVEVMHLPGHTRGHCAFVVPADGVAFVGDVDLSTFGPYYGDHWSDLDDFVASIARVRTLDAQTYVTFHHKGVVRGRAAFAEQLDRFASVIDRRDERLLALLEQPRTVTELVEIGLIYRPGSRPQFFGASVERRSILMHLARLERGGAVRRDGELVSAE